MPKRRHLATLELFYMDGCADEVSGNVDAPTGHFYRVAAQIVTTDSQGFSSVTSFDSLAAAKAEFQRLDAEYAKWDGDA